MFLSRRRRGVERVDSVSGMEGRRYNSASTTKVPNVAKHMGGRYRCDGNLKRSEA